MSTTPGWSGSDVSSGRSVSLTRDVESLNGFTSTARTRKSFGIVVPIPTVTSDWPASASGAMVTYAATVWSSSRCTFDAVVPDLLKVNEDISPTSGNAPVMRTGNVCPRCPSEGVMLGVGTTVNKLRQPGRSLAVAVSAPVTTFTSSGPGGVAGRTFRVSLKIVSSSTCTLSGYTIAPENVTIGGAVLKCVFSPVMVRGTS